MGSNGSCYAIWVIIIQLSVSISTFAFVDHHHHDPVALDLYLRNYSSSAISKTGTGVPHKVDLPANFSGMDVSVIRLRSSRFWARGAQFDPFFDIPPKILPLPYVKRLEIMYENLGNWSSYYYNLPGYSFLAPVIGFTVYSASLSQNNTNQRLNLTVLGRPISINFTNIVIPQHPKREKVKCVRFQLNGQVELSEMISPNVCSSLHEGHFSIADSNPKPIPPSPSPPTEQAPPPTRQRKSDLWKLWVIGFGTGIVGIFLLCLLGMFICRVCILKRIRWMERNSDRAEALSTRWIRNSRMPSAYMTRTQATLENDYAP